MKIGNREIGEHRHPLIIAEIGINHGGNLSTAKAMVDAAFKCGIEVVKHQTHIVEDEMSHHAQAVIPANADKSIYHVIEECALNEQDETELANYVWSLGMEFISTPFSRAAVERLERIGVKAYKIGSGECNNYPLVELIASKRKPIILSTGMNSLDTIRPAVEIIESQGISYALLHCTNLYPTPHHLVRLGAMSELKTHFPNAQIGLSDHTVDNYACLGAVALGATILERHFTDSMGRSGPDIVNSMDPDSAQQLIEGSKALFLARGGCKGRIKEEKVTEEFAYGSVVTIKDVIAGERFTTDNIWVKRPSGGDFGPSDFKALLGKTSETDIPADTQISRQFVGE